MKKITCYSFLFFILFACDSGKKTGEVNKFNEIPTEKNEKNTTSKLGCTKEKKQLFSDHNQSDIFKLLYNCKNVEDSMKFQIFKSSGQLIYELNFAGSDFYDYSRPWYEYVTDPERGKDFDPDKMSNRLKDSLHKEDLKFIKRRIETLFNADKFERNPLLNCEYNLIDDPYLDEFKRDTSTIGFSFCIGSVEGYQTIAYSRKEKKVLTIISSD